MDSLRQKAERDPLTGLYAKAAIQNLIEQYLEAVQSNEKCALLMIDIDDFKVVNDTMGHLFGDAVLSDLSASIRGETRSSDLVGRIGGDEFLVFLKNIPSAQTALQKSQRFLSVVQDLFREKKNKIAISCSIGISLFPAHGHNFRSLYQCADIALYQAKGKGKNTSCLYSAQMLHPLWNHIIPDRLSIPTRLGTANTRQLTEYVFQTLYHAESIEQAIPLILEVVGCQFDVSRAYVFENSEDGCFCSNTFEWCNVGISSQKKNSRTSPMLLWTNTWITSMKTVCSSVKTLKIHRNLSAPCSGSRAFIPCFNAPCATMVCLPVLWDLTNAQAIAYGQTKKFTL